MRQKYASKKYASDGNGTFRRPFLKVPVPSDTQIQPINYRGWMGLDSVEIVVRSEAFFNIAISDGEAAQVRTVGDFYVLIITEWKKSGMLFRKAVHLPPPTEVMPWSPESVWNCLVAIFVDQQGLKQDRVRFGARIAEDLGVD
jgi:hypothetical protein